MSSLSIWSIQSSEKQPQVKQLTAYVPDKDALDYRQLLREGLLSEEENKRADEGTA